MEGEVLGQVVVIKRNGTDGPTFPIIKKDYSVTFGR